MSSLRLWCHNCFNDLNFELYWNMVGNPGNRTGIFAVAADYFNRLATVADDVTCVKRP